MLPVYDVSQKWWVQTPPCPYVSQDQNLHDPPTLGQSVISIIGWPKAAFSRGFPCNQNKTLLSRGKQIFSGGLKSYSMK